METKPSLKERQRALREEAILDAAVELISEKGFASVTLEQVADAACVSKPTLYLHFRSKEDVVIHLTMRCMGLAKERLLAIPADLPIEERLHRFLKSMVDFRLDARISRSIDLAQHLLPIKHGNPELICQEAELKEMFTSVLTEGQAHGIVRPDLPASFLCQVVISLFKDQATGELVLTGEAADLLTSQLMALLGVST